MADPLSAVLATGGFLVLALLFLPLILFLIGIWRIGTGLLGISTALNGNPGIPNVAASLARMTAVLEADQPGRRDSAPAAPLFDEAMRLSDPEKKSNAWFWMLVVIALVVVVVLVLSNVFHL